MPIQSVIVIPCYNEASRLEPATFIEFLNANANMAFIFVNDGSSDSTHAILSQIALAVPSEQAYVIDLIKNSGKAEAVRQGFLKGFSLSPEYIGYIDADLATPLESIHELKFTLIKNRKDIAVGSRVVLMGWHVERNNARHYAGRFFATAASMVLGLRIYDTQCGAKLFRVTERLKTVFAAPFTVKWIFDVEILARFIITDNDGNEPTEDICVEYPLPVWIDKKGSKLRFTDFIISALDLLSIARIIRKKSLPRA